MVALHGHLLGLVMVLTGIKCDINTYMDGISKALNTSFSSSVNEVSTKIKEIEKKSQNYENVRMVIEDKEYIRTELIELISSTQVIKKLVEEELQRPPIKASLIESYAMLNEKINGYLRELRQLNIDVVNAELSQRKIDSIHQRATGEKTTNNVFLLDASALDKMVSDAKANSMLNAIEVDFKIDNIK